MMVRGLNISPHATMGRDLEAYAMRGLRSDGRPNTGLTGSEELPRVLRTLWYGPDIHNFSATLSITGNAVRIAI